MNNDTMLRHPVYQDFHGALTLQQHHENQKPVAVMQQGIVSFEPECLWMLEQNFMIAADLLEYLQNYGETT